VAEALETLNVLRGNQQQIILKEEQEVAVEKLLLGQDVLAVLPTGYGKSMIFTVFALAKQLMKRTEKDISTSILVISPLTSITADQITEMQSYIGFRCCRTWRTDNDRNHTFSTAICLQQCRTRHGTKIS
jgi:superfamily II DNA helicase RecQ